MKIKPGTLFRFTTTYRIKILIFMFVEKKESHYCFLYEKGVAKIEDWILEDWLKEGIMKEINNNET